MGMRAGVGLSRAVPTADRSVLSILEEAIGGPMLLLVKKLLRCLHG